MSVIDARDASLAGDLLQDREVLFREAVVIVAPQLTPSRDVLVDEVGRMGFATTVGPAALYWTLAQLNREFQADAESERPTPYALQTAERLLSGAQRLVPGAIAPSVLESFEGDLILHWDFGKKGMALVCPAWGDRSPQLYTEVLQGKKPLRTKLLDNPGPAEIASSIEWLLQPAE